MKQKFGKVKIQVTEKLCGRLLEGMLKEKIVIPVGSYNEIIYKILERYEYGEVVTVGILVADWEQDEARQYIINYMDCFDKKAGKYIDFFIPGYYEKEDEVIFRGDYVRANDEVRQGRQDEQAAFTLHRLHKTYYFSRTLYQDFLIEMEYRMKIQLTYNPMLILVEVNQSKCRGVVDFQRKLVIELDEDSNRGLRRSGQLFDAIFDFAKEKTGLGAFQNNIRCYYMRGKVVPAIIKFLEGNYIESVRCVMGDYFRCRIR